MSDFEQRQATVAYVFQSARMSLLTFRAVFGPVVLGICAASCVEGEVNG